RDATALLREAEKGRDDARAGQEADLKKREAFGRFLSQGQTAMAAKRYAEAITAYTEALELIPGDAAATKALRAATAAQDAARADAEKQKRTADYQAAIKAGRDALAAKRYDDAIKAFADAGRLQPGDPTAAALLKDAQKAKADVASAAEAEAKR